MIAKLNPHVRVETHDTRIDAGNALEIIGGYDIVADGSDNFRYPLPGERRLLSGRRTLVFAAVGPFDGYVTTLKPHETGPDGQPYPVLSLHLSRGAAARDGRELRRGRACWVRQSASSARCRRSRC